MPSTHPASTRGVTAVLAAALALFVAAAAPHVAALYADEGPQGEHHRLVVVEFLTGSEETP